MLDTLWVIPAYIILLFWGLSLYYARKQEKPLQKTNVEWCNESEYCEDCKKQGTCNVWKAINTH